MNIQRCALFSVNRGTGECALEAGYPEEGHGIGKTRCLEEPYIQAILSPQEPFGQFEHERIQPNYILITDPRGSRLVPGDLKYFLETQDIHSVLYLPLKREGEVNYFLTFDAQGHHESFRDEEIEILLFLGKELMKGLWLEKLYDTLHDSKNVAIFLSYFARRIQTIFQKEKFPENERLNQAVEIILEGGDRLQEMFLSLFAEGRESIVDMTEMARRRLLYYQDTMREMKRDGIHFDQSAMTASLRVRCVPFKIERVIDNLLANAVFAIPEEGGQLSIRTRQEEPWGIMEIANTSRVSREEIDRHLESAADGKGRGLHICNQLVSDMGGNIEVAVKDGMVIFQVKLPALKP
jgi:signal transduction histidine kinase